MSPDCTVSRLTDLLGNDSTDVLPLTNAGPSALGINSRPLLRRGQGTRSLTAPVKVGASH